MTEITDVIGKLLERTEEGKVSWRTTADENTFLAVVSSTSILVSAHGYISGNQQFRFRILNQRATEIANYETPTHLDADIRSQLSELYSKARHQALGVDSQLDELLKELESAG